MISSEPPSAIFFRIKLGTLSRKTIAELEASPNPGQYVRERIYIDYPMKIGLVEDKYLYHEEYSRISALYEYDPVVLTWPPSVVVRLYTEPPDPLMTIRDPYYANPVQLCRLFPERFCYGAACRNCCSAAPDPNVLRYHPSDYTHVVSISIRAILSIRSYIFSQDIQDLRTAPIEEIETVFSHIPFMEKVGSFWVPVDVSNRIRTARIDIPTDATPSFGLYRMLVSPIYYQHPPPAVLVVDQAPVNSVMIRLPDDFLIPSTCTKIQACQYNPCNIVFQTNSIEEEKRVQNLPHFVFSNLTRIQGYATAIRALFAERSFMFILLSNKKS